MTPGTSTPAQYATLGVIFLLVVLVRFGGRWLINRGSAMERDKHDVPPHTGPRLAEAEAAHAEDTPAEPERYDPFNAG